MDHATTTDALLVAEVNALLEQAADALLAEVDALLEQAAATDARVDALLDGAGPRHATTLRLLLRTARHQGRLSALEDALLDGWAPRHATALRRLQRTARHTARLSALVERQQAALSAQLDAIEQGA